MNWINAQKRLGVVADNKPGTQTITALLTYVLNKAPNADIVKGFVQNISVFTTPQRLADFIGQTCHESINYTDFTENLNYSATSALKTWPSHFNTALANWADRNPERIAEVAYGIKSKTGHGRMGNTQAGDGYKYRGRGPLQITGKTNYQIYGKAVGADLVNHPELAERPDIGIAIAIAYYNTNGVWKAIDENDPLGARKIVNMGNRNAKGQPLGYTHVNDIRNKVLSLFRP